MLPLDGPGLYEDHDGAACKRFAVGFLERCLRDLLLDFDKKSDAREWLAGADCLFPFRLVCEFLDVDETRMRQQIEKLSEKPTRQLNHRRFISVELFRSGLSATSCW